MRAARLLPVVIVAAMLAGGCGPSRHAAETAAGDASPAHVRATAPANPDLGTVMERYYQYIGGRHWQFAYAMLSPRYRATLSQDAFVARYEDLADADVAIRHRPGTVVVAQLDGVDRKDRSRRVHVLEVVKLVWDGEQWTIDDIARRGARSRTR